MQRNENYGFVSSPLGAYAQLGQYNGAPGAGSYGKGTLGAPYVAPSTVSGVYIVPNYAPIQYDSLTHNTAPTFGGYFDITNAYSGGNGGAGDAANCNTQYFQRLCNGGIPNSRPVYPPGRS